MRASCPTGGGFRVVSRIWRSMWLEITASLPMIGPPTTVKYALLYSVVTNCTYLPFLFSFSSRTMEFLFSFLPSIAAPAASSMFFMQLKVDKAILYDRRSLTFTTKVIQLAVFKDSFIIIQNKM